MAHLSQEFLSKYKTQKPPHEVTGMIVYKRTYSRNIESEGRKEEWWETCAREVNSIMDLGLKLTREEMEDLYDSCFNLKCSFSGRAKWQLGSPTVERIGGASMNNCWGVVVDCWKSFVFTFDMLMLGGGVGFNIQRENVYQIPKVKPGVVITRKDTNDADFIVPDSREGWCELLSRVMQAFFETGKGFSYSTVCIRGKGVAIKGFGGVSSGPEDLCIGLQKICNVIGNRSGKKIRPIDALDIMDIVAEIVVAGNCRRSALLSLGDMDDVQFLNAKRWDLGIPNWRKNSNNSIVCNDIKLLPNKYWNSFKKDPKTGFAKGEIYGLINLSLARKKGRVLDCHRTDPEVYVFNPCQPEFASILTPNGIKNLGDINIGDTIWSGKNWTTVLDKWTTGVKSVFEYETTAGTFIGTENHRVVENGIKVEAQNASGIDTCQGNPVISGEIIPSIVMDGLVIGDGGVHKASNDLVLLYVGKKDFDYFSSEISNLFIRERKGISPYTWEISTNISANELPPTFDRQVPSRFLHGTPNEMRSFLRGIYSANGSICGNRVTLKTTSFILLRQVQIMLSALGIKSYYTTNKSKYNKFSNGEYECRESYDLNISDNKDKFYDLIGFLQKYKMNKLNKLITSTRKSKGKITFPIKNKKYIGNFPVFDMTVDDPEHTYWTGGVLVSNCGEIGLSAVPNTGEGESCNLFELFIARMENKDHFIRIAKLGYKVVKTIASLRYHWENTNTLIHENMRLGISVSGMCEWLPKLGREEAANWLDSCYKELEYLDASYSKEMNWSESIKLTTVKPSGSLSKLCHTSPGVHPFYAPYYIQRIRFASEDPLLDKLREANYPIEYQMEFDGTLNTSTSIVSFPMKAPEGSIMAKDMSAVDQMELVKFMNTYWSDNSTSVTVYYKEEELDSIKEWLENNYNDYIKSISFLLHSDHGFKQAPMEEIDEATYKKMTKNLKEIDFSLQKEGSFEIETNECSTGACPIK